MAVVLFHVLADKRRICQVQQIFIIIHFNQNFEPQIAIAERNCDKNKVLIQQAFIKLFHIKYCLMAKFLSSNQIVKVASHLLQHNNDIY